MHGAGVMPGGWDHLRLIIADGSSEIYQPKEKSVLMTMLKAIGETLFRIENRNSIL
jgi:hypothetical protein